MKRLAFFLIAIAFSTPVLLSNGFPGPNRGKQLFITIQGPILWSRIVAMTPDRRLVIANWNRYNPTYNFISAIVRHTSDGCSVNFTRYVMKDDYIPRTESLDLNFPYDAQPRYRFFEDGVYILGFYRRSAGDIDPHEIVPNDTHLTQSMKPTQHFVVSLGSMRTPILKVLGGLSSSR